MEGQPGSLAILEDALMQHLAGVDAALESARGLLQAATMVLLGSEPTASYLVSMAAEEIGKALLLRRRERALLHNAETRLHTQLFRDDPFWIDGAKHLIDVLPWGAFVGRGKGGLCDHRAKLAALRDYYKDAHPHVVENSGSRIVLASIDMFAGLSAAQVRTTVENAVYVGWDPAARTWRLPRPCVNSVDAFVAAMQEVVERIAADLPASRERIRVQVRYIGETAAHSGFDVDQICAL